MQRKEIEKVYIKDVLNKLRIEIKEDIDNDDKFPGDIILDSLSNIYNDLLKDKDRPAKKYKDDDISLYMDLNKVKKYLQIYLDEVIEPKLNRELVGEDDEPIKIKVYDVKQKEHLPEEMVIFLDMEPDWSHGSIIPHINTDIVKFQ